jgi:hypothetical protein
MGGEKFCLFNIRYKCTYLVSNNLFLLVLGVYVYAEAFFMKAQKNTCTNSKEAQLPSNDCRTGTYKDQKAKIITIWPNTRWHSKIYKLGLGELTQ